MTTTCLPSAVIGAAAGARPRPPGERVPDAGGAGAAPADDDAVLALGGDGGGGGRGDGRLGAELRGDPAVAHVEVAHREVDAVEPAPVEGQVARHARAD